MIVTVLALLLLSGCARHSKADTPTSIKGKLEYARCLRIYEEHGHTVVVIVAPDDSTKIQAQYILLPEGAHAPQTDMNVQVINVPVVKTLVYTAVHAAAFDELGKSNVIKGVADADYFKTEHIMDGLRDGSISNIGPSSSPSHEKIIHLAPQVIILNNYEGMQLRGVDKLGIPVMEMAENLETTPLGRAEWIKLFGELTCQREKADSIFSVVKHNYTTLANAKRSVERKPKVITETMYEGVWYVPAGDSYQAQMLADAGADYPWRDMKGTGSLNLSFEQVLEQGADADFWLLRLMRSDFTLGDLLSLDCRYSAFKPAKDGDVWYADTGSSFLFERTTYHPDELLADYVSIFSGHGGEAKYFKRVASK